MVTQKQSKTQTNRNARTIARRAIRNTIIAGDWVAHYSGCGAVDYIAVIIETLDSNTALAYRVDEVEGKLVFFETTVFMHTPYMQMVYKIDNLSEEILDILDEQEAVAQVAA